MEPEMKSTKRFSGRQYLESRIILEKKVKAPPQVPLAQQYELDDGLTGNRELNVLRAHGEMPVQAKRLQTGHRTTYNE